MGKYFGTDGFRGEANVTLNVMHAYKIGRFLGNFFQNEEGKRVRIVIGKDTKDMKLQEIEISLLRANNRYIENNE